MLEETTIQKLINYAIEKYGSSSNIANDIICKAMELKKDEKQQIIKAWLEGGAMLGAKNAQEYYNNNYKQ